jgi:hypothetical protein
VGLAAFNPGMDMRLSTQAMARLTANAEPEYNSVTAR